MNTKPLTSSELLHLAADRLDELIVGPNGECTTPGTMILASDLRKLAGPKLGEAAS